MKLPYLIYKRIRAGLGITLGFILMYGAITSNLNYNLVMIGIGFFLIHLFGDMYNDCCDYREDIRNGRKEKLTVSGFFSTEKMKTVSFLILASGLLLLLLINIMLFPIGLFCAMLLFSYSNPKIRFKKKNWVFYLLSTIIAWPIIILTLGIFFSENFTLKLGVFSAFCTFQFFYMLCQKDSTDRKDETNLFLEKKWIFAWTICAISSVIVLSCLFLISTSTFFLAPFLINFAAKTINLVKIKNKTITRTLRSKIVLLEFATPYIYMISSIHF